MEQKRTKTSSSSLNKCRPLTQHDRPWNWWPHSQAPVQYATFEDDGRIIIPLARERIRKDSREKGQERQAWTTVLANEHVDDGESIELEYDVVLSDEMEDLMDPFGTRRRCNWNDSPPKEDREWAKGYGVHYEHGWRYFCNPDTVWIYVQNQRDKSGCLSFSEGSSHRYCPTQSFGNAFGISHGLNSWIRLFYPNPRTENGRENNMIKPVRRFVNRQMQKRTTRAVLNGGRSERREQNDWPSRKTVMRGWRHGHTFHLNQCRKEK